VVDEDVDDGGSAGSLGLANRIGQLTAIGHLKPKGPKTLGEHHMVRTLELRCDLSLVLVVARPIPLAAPVMAAVRPDRSNS
jgi:hypothetical protein